MEDFIEGSRMVLRHGFVLFVSLFERAEFSNGNVFYEAIYKKRLLDNNLKRIVSSVNWL